MILEASITTLDELYDNMVRNYELGYFVEGISAVSYTHLTLPTNREV